MWRSAAVGLALLAAGAAAAQEAAPAPRPGEAPGTAPAAGDGDVVSIDAWDARYCEFLLVKGRIGDFTADVYNTLGLDTCDPAVFREVDADAIRKQFDARAVFKNGPRFWVVSTLSTHAATADAPAEDFGGIKARLVGELKLARGMRSRGSIPYEPTTIQRDTQYTYAPELPVFILDDPDGTPWVMQAYSQIVDPTLTLEALGDLGGRLKLPQGWRFRTLVLDRELVVHPVDGTARILQDDFENTYDACFETACSYKP